MTVVSYTYINIQLYDEWNKINKDTDINYYYIVWAN